MSIHSRKGFTLVELMIVIGIIGILAATLFPSLTAYLQRGRDTATQANIVKMQQKLSDYLQNKGEIPGMLLGNTTWYCIKMSPPVDPNCFLFVQDFATSMEVFSEFQSSDFSNAPVGLVTPMLQKVGIGESYTGTVFPNEINDSGKYQYILHWIMPGISDGVVGQLIGGTFTGSSQYPFAYKRCAPGIVRWIDGRQVGDPNTNNKTGCQMLVSY